MKEWIKRNEVDLVLLSIILFFGYYLVPNDHLLMKQTICVLFFGLLSLVYWFTPSSYFVLRVLGYLNIGLFFIHSILLFLVIYLV